MIAWNVNHLSPSAFHGERGGGGDVGEMTDVSDYTHKAIFRYGKSIEINSARYLKE